MTFESFRSKYIGKQVEYHSYDPKAKFQCVDLVNQYIVEVLGLDPVIGTNAKDFPAKYNKDQFDWVPNSLMGVPPKGSIIVWNGKVGNGAGHIAIVKSANLMSFKSLDQNWSKPLYVTDETHSYKNVQGWLIPRSMEEFNPTKSMPDIVKAMNEFKEGVKIGLWGKNDALDTIFQKILGKIRELEDKIMLKQASIDFCKENEISLKERIKTLENAKPEGIFGEEEKKLLEAIKVIYSYKPK